MEGLTVRAMAPSDRQAVEEMLGDSWLSEQRARLALSALDAPSCLSVIALAGDGGTVVGLGVMRLEAAAEGPPIASVVHLAVRRTMRGRGVGAALLEGLRAEAVTRKCREMRVATRARPGP